MAIVATLAADCGAATARDIVNAALKTPSIDLIPVLEAVETDKAQVAIEIPDASAQKSLMTLDAKGPGPLHRWVVFSLLNPDAVPHDLVIVSPHQGFVGSGFFWPKREGSRLYGVQNSADAEAIPLRALGMDALAFRIGPNASQTFALELAPAGLGSLSLWQRNAFEAQAGEYAFFRGVVLGIAMLLAIAIMSFFIVRQRAVFLAATLFAWASVVFLTIEAGYLPDIQRWLGLGVDDGPKLRASVESMLLAGVILCLSTFLELRKRMPLLGNVLLGCAALAAGLAAYGWFEPAIATGIARLAFGFFILFGYVLIFTLWREGGLRARASILTWTVLLAWTAMAAFGALDIIPSPNTRLVISAGLALVLLTMGFTLAQFAFSHGILSSRFFEDSGRRALALAGSEQTVWDWQPERGTLYVGPELERALGIEPGVLMSRGLKSWIDLIHPADRSAYVAAVEAAERRGRGTFSQEFRLRRHDGAYRWYLLRARSMIGQDGRASRCIGTLADITSMKRSEDRLLSDAVRDRVTGLPNRALFLDRLEFAMRRAHLENNRELYVLVIDLDRFKTVNDGLGHEVGDSLLSVTGRRLATLMGPEDTLARLPGDQFAVIFNGKKPKRDVIPFAEQIRTTLSRPIKLRGRELFLTASFGVARFLDDRSSPQDFVKDAEIALYEAKRRGRDSIEFFRPDMRDDRSELLALEQDLRRAIERNEIEVVYQPISRLSDMQLSGFEALVRWRHRTEGLLGPDSFMSLAEETGIIKDLSHYVLNEAARQLGIWQRAFRPEKPLFVSVNMSSSQLLNTDLVDDVRALLGREDISPGTLKLELTESLIMENPEFSAEILERLKALGVGLACDDFGTGYSALASLRRLPFDILKIDKSFLDADLEDEKAMIILETIILLAHDLNMTVVAEGIESQEQIAALAELECDLGQGFLIGEPMTAKQVVEALGGGSFAGPKPVFGSLWNRLGGRRAAEISAPLPSRALVQSGVPAKPAEQPVLPALEAVQAALYGATQALALQKREPAAQMNGPDAPEPAEAEAASDEALAPVDVSENMPATESANASFAPPEPEPLPPPPPPPRPAQISGLSASTPVAAGPKPGTAPFVPRPGRPIVAPIPIAPRAPQKRPKVATEQKEEPRPEPEPTEQAAEAITSPPDVQEPSQVAPSKPAAEIKVEVQEKTEGGEEPVRGEQDLRDGEPVEQLPPDQADEQGQSALASDEAAASAGEVSPLPGSAAEQSAASGAGETAEPATGDQVLQETAAEGADAQVPAEKPSEPDGSAAAESRIEEEEKPPMLRRQRRKSKAAKLT
jgi:diguanylate cyclase (GGDEF)-like protein/PAS domain S-box-containing protein